MKKNKLNSKITKKIIFIIVIFLSLILILRDTPAFNGIIRSIKERFSIEGSKLGSTGSLGLIANRIETGQAKNVEKSAIKGLTLTDGIDEKTDKISKETDSTNKEVESVSSKSKELSNQITLIEDDKNDLDTEVIQTQTITGDALNILLTKSPDVELEVSNKTNPAKSQYDISIIKNKIPVNTLPIEKNVLETAKEAGAEERNSLKIRAKTLIQKIN